jgi:hypothetical protein
MYLHMNAIPLVFIYQHVNVESKTKNLGHNSDQTTGMECM